MTRSEALSKNSIPAVGVGAGILGVSIVSMFFTPPTQIMTIIALFFTVGGGYFAYTQELKKDGEDE